MSANTPEGKVKNKIRALFEQVAARSNGKLWYCMPMGQMYGKRGVPDFLVCVSGEFLAVEAKAEKGKLSAMQKFELKRIADAYGYTFVAYPDNLETLERMLGELAEYGATTAPCFTDTDDEAIW